MNAVARLPDLDLRQHPPYQDPRLKGALADVFASADGRIAAVYWVAEGPGTLLERPKADELICILEGEARVAWQGNETNAGPGDVILWLQDDPPQITISERLIAFCVVYRREA